MQSLKITLKFTSPVGSELQSDTIFGQFAWEFRYIFGEEKLLELLSNFEREPFLIFSDGFLENTVSMPFIKPEDQKRIKEQFGDDYYIKMKYLKKAKFVKIGQWVKNKVNLFTLSDSIIEDSGFKKASFIRNSVNRISNTTKEGLYSTQENFFEQNIDVYVKYDNGKISKGEILQVFESVGKFGFGRDKSTGKGRFQVENVVDNPEILNFREKSNAFISLSSGVPCDDCSVLFGKTFTKFGKHGGDLVFGNPFKNPAILFKSGSSFQCSEKKEVYGRTLNVSNYNGHYQNTFMIPLFVNMEV
jgi:CRISPR-associated protein Csm4